MKKQTTHIDKMATDCIAVRIRLLNRVITGVYDDALKPYGLKTSQANILTVISKVGQATPTDVCRFLHMDVSTVSRNVERMRKRGWLDTVRGEDGRSYLLKVSVKGAGVLKEAEDILGKNGVKVISKIADCMLASG